MKNRLAFLLVATIVTATNVNCAEIPDFIQNCMDCHGENGVSKEPDVPTIAGFSATFIEETFAAYTYDMRNPVESRYRYGDTSRKPTDMRKIADTLNEDQIIKAAEFFESQTYVPAKQKFDASLVETGKKIHTDKCEKCHREGGKGREEDAAILAGQWTPYLRSAFKHIMNETRDVDVRMTKKVEKLGDEEWEALLNYYASQQ